MGGSKVFTQDRVLNWERTLFLHGPEQTGKTTAIRNIFKLARNGKERYHFISHLGLAHVYLDCPELKSSQSVFTTIKNQLSDNKDIYLSNISSFSSWLSQLSDEEIQQSTKRRYSDLIEDLRSYLSDKAILSDKRRTRTIRNDLGLSSISKTQEVKGLAEKKAEEDSKKVDYDGETWFFGMKGPYPLQELVPLPMFASEPLVKPIREGSVSNSPIDDYLDGLDNEEDNELLPWGESDKETIFAAAQASLDPELSKMRSQDQSDIELSCDAIKNLTDEIISRYTYKSGDTIYFVLENAEFLLDRHSSLFYALMRISEFSQRPICLVVLSRLPWSRFGGSGKCVVPRTIHFPAYFDKELIEIITTLKPNEVATDEAIPPHMFRTFVDAVVKSVFNAVRSLPDLSRLCLILWEVYSAPLKYGENTLPPQRLWAAISPLIKIVLDKVYLREITDLQWDEAVSSPQIFSTKLRTSATKFVLPPLTLYLLLCSYLCSYIPAKLDSRLHSDKTTSRRRISSKAQKAFAPQIEGPGVFSHERMMSMLVSVYPAEQPAPADAVIAATIQKLVRSDLLGVINQSDMISSPKYVCHMSFDMAMTVAARLRYHLPDSLAMV